MSVRIDPTQGTETTVSDHSRLVTSTTGGTAPMGPWGHLEITRTVEQTLADRPWRAQPKGTRPMPASFRPAMTELARRLHSGEMPASESYWWDGPGVVWRGKLWADPAELNAALGIGTAKVAAVTVAPVKVERPAVKAPSTATLPADVEEWLARLVFETKASYARSYALAKCAGFPMPADPGTDWAHKARRGVDRLISA